MSRDISNLERIFRFALIISFLVLVSSVFSCTFLPKSEQFVSSGISAMVVRSDGECSTTDHNDTVISRASGLNPEKITILDWNIYKEKKSGLLQDLRALVTRADIVLLQEVAYGPGLLDILHLNHPYWNFNSSFTYWGVETGVLIAATVPPLTSCGERATDLLIGLPKTAVISSYALYGSSQKLMVANIHAINFTLGTKSYEQQFDELQKTLIHHKGPLILAGDFNNWNEERTSIIRRIAQNLSLTTLELEDDVRSTFFGRPVDHILYRGLEPLSYKAYRVDSSDHNPLLATFRVVE